MSPITTSKVVVTDLNTVKNAIEKLARDGQKLTNASQGGNIYMTSIPTADQIDEGAFVFYVSGATYRIYTKINGNLKYWNLT